MGFRRLGVIMAGGSGERFWPVSTPSEPKQFLRLTNPDHSLLQEAVGRADDLFGATDTYIATGQPLAQRSRVECPGLPSENVLAEPAKRNTLGCLVWVAANLMAKFPSDWPSLSIAVLTADHKIHPTAAFHDTVTQALDLAEQTGGLVTIGIVPQRPETGYGYIDVGAAHGPGFQVNSFREKPDLETAKRYLESGNFLWNSGMFFWTLAGFMSEMEQAQPDATAIVREIAGQLTQGQSEAARAAFERLTSLSIDYALMENAKRVFVVRSSFEWDDLGSWDSLVRSIPLDRDGNAVVGPARFLDAKGCVVYNDNPNLNVSVLGLEGVIVVVAEGQVLVCPLDRAQDVKLLKS